MANQPETAIYRSGIYQIELTDPVRGGVGGLTNTPLLQLADRTAYLKEHVDLLESTRAPTNSPQFTGSPLAPTPPRGSIGVGLATPAFVLDLIGGVASLDIAGTGTMTPGQPITGAGHIILYGALTGPRVVVLPRGPQLWTITNSTSGAATVTVRTASGSGVDIAQGYRARVMCQNAIDPATGIVFANNDYTNIAVRGVSTCPTPPPGANSLQITNAAFVDAVRAALAGANTTNANRIEAVARDLTAADTALYNNLLDAINRLDRDKIGRAEIVFTAGMNGILRLHNGWMIAWGGGQTGGGQTGVAFASAFPQVCASVIASEADAQGWGATGEPTVFGTHNADRFGFQLRCCQVRVTGPSYAPGGVGYSYIATGY